MKLREELRLEDQSPKIATPAGSSNVEKKIWSNHLGDYNKTSNNEKGETDKEGGKEQPTENVSEMEQIGPEDQARAEVNQSRAA